MITRKYWVVLFFVAWTFFVCLLLQYRGNSVDTKRAAITNRTTDKKTDRNLKSVDMTKNATSSLGNLSNFIYLMQTESCIPSHLLHSDIFGYGCKNDVLVLS